MAPRLRFLVAEDDEEWRNIIVHILEVDYDLAGVVERGDQIIDAARKFLPDVITLDVSMPGKSGVMALPGLRAIVPNAIIVVISSTATPLYIEEAFARGADGYLEKGSRVPTNLIETIASVRDRHSEQQRLGH